MGGKCPHCGQVLTSVTVHAVNAVDSANMNRTWRAAAFICPACNTILGTAFDQTVLPSVVAGEVLRRLGR